MHLASLDTVNLKQSIKSGVIEPDKLGGKAGLQVLKALAKQENWTDDTSHKQGRNKQKNTRT